MAAVTQRINSYLKGVSKQPDSKKQPGQVRECINGFPDVTLGLTKRPGFKFTSVLKNSSGANFTGTSLAGAKWFYINRGTGVRYIGCITPKVSGSVDGDIFVWNADTGVACTVSYDAPNWAASTAYVVGEKVKQDTGNIYTCTTAGTSASSGGPEGTGSDIDDGGTLKWEYTTTISAAESASTYLTGLRDNYDVLTVHDTTLITNNTVTVASRPAPTFVAQSRGTVLLVSDLIKLQGFDIEVKVNGEACTYPVEENDTVEQIMTGIKNSIDTNSSLDSDEYTTQILGNSIQIDREDENNNPLTFTLEAKGGMNYLDVVVFQDWAENHTNLPPQSIHNHVVEVINTKEESQDNYYAKFVANNGVSGFGYWKETIGPHVSPGLNNTTMPHRLVNTGLNKFTFEKIDYKDREVGDDFTNEMPSFVGSTIQQAFFHTNRLGFLTTDHVVMSKEHDPFNFFFLSAMNTGNADPIDVSVSSIRPAVIHAVKPSRQGLILFAKSQQFLMYSDAGPITSKTVKIQAISSMEMDQKVDPVDVGSHFNFISKTPNYTRVFAMQTKGFGENPQVLDIGRVVNEWITIDVDNLVASRQNDFIAMSSQTSDEVFFYKTYTDGQDLLLESWFKWKLLGLVQTVQVDQDDMFSVVYKGDQYTLSTCNLTQSPEAAIIVNSDGQKVNPCIDFYTPATSVSFDSDNNRSKCYIPFANLTDKKPIIIVAGSTAQGGFVESGFTLIPEVGSDPNGDVFFSAPDKDLSGVASDVYVGYTYDFDITLPTIHFKMDDKGLISDYTSRLTISRLNFDVGLSGILGFKLNATGRFANTINFTGDNTTKKFSWIASDLPFIDRNQVNVKINNVITTDFEYISDTEIEFNTAPATNDAILVYLDEWYDLQPVTTANAYLANDVPLDESTIFTIPIHQRSKNYQLRLFSDSPFPVSLNSMMWEGNYSPRFYRRT